MKKIIYTRPDGGVSVVYPVISADDPEGFTEQQALQRAHKDVPADAIEPTVVEDIPSDRTFRNAWRQRGAQVEVDMPKAREIHRERLRRIRAPRLAAEDVNFMRALERGEPTSPIAARKQALRDAPADPAIEAAATPEELKLLAWRA
jgi:hypothetical protein